MSTIAEVNQTDADLSWRGPSPRLRLLRRLEVVAVALVVAGVGVLIALTSDTETAGIVVIVVAVVLALVADFLLGRRVRAWGYAERAEDLIVRRGVMVKRQSVVPYGRMQFVDVKAGPLEQLMGLATVQLHTAAAHSDARIPGLPAAEAQRLRDQLSALGESQAAGL